MIINYQLSIINYQLSIINYSPYTLHPTPQKPLRLTLVFPKFPARQLGGC